MYLVDTNILIYAAQGIEPVASLFEEWVGRDEVVLSVVPISEFLVGATEKEAIKIERLLEVLRVLPIDLASARQAASYRKKYSRKKKAPFLVDCFLAATAKLYNLTLVTHDVANFPMQDIKIYDPLA